MMQLNFKIPTYRNKLTTIIKLSNNITCKESIWHCKLNFVHFLFVLLIFCLNTLSLNASYAPLHQTNNIEQSLEDESLIKLAHSNMHYDNVGVLCFCNNPIREMDESKFRSKASAVYIGDGICLTAAHTRLKDAQNAVHFEINGRRTPLYHVSKVIIHPKYEENDDFDIAMLILDKPVDGLDGLTPCYEFSKELRYLKDYQHLLTYVAYGVKLIHNGWCYSADQKRRALQSYTCGCDTRPKTLGLYSSPYGNSNDLKEKRGLIPYEAKCRGAMSGGAVIHPEYGLVSIFAGTKNLRVGAKFSWIAKTLLFCCMNAVLEQINDYLFKVPLLNEAFISDSSVMWSVPLYPVKDWIEEKREIYKV